MTFCQTKQMCLYVFGAVQRKKTSRKCIHPVILCVVYWANICFCLAVVHFFSSSFDCFEIPNASVRWVCFLRHYSIIISVIWWRFAVSTARHSAVLATLETGFPERISSFFSIFKTGLSLPWPQPIQFTHSVSIIFIALIPIELFVAHTQLQANCISHMIANFWKLTLGNFMAVFLSLNARDININDWIKLIVYGGWDQAFSLIAHKLIRC